MYIKVKQNHKEKTAVWKLIGLFKLNQNQLWETNLTTTGGFEKADES